MDYFEAANLIDSFVDRVKKNEIDYLKARMEDRQQFPAENCFGP